MNFDDLRNSVEITRRNLPHWHKENCIQFVTFHLADSLPAKVRAEITDRKNVFLKDHPQPWTSEIQSKFNTLFPNIINEYLDAGYGACVLRRTDCSKIMSDVLHHFDGQRYSIHKFVIMPNHVHILVELYPTYTLSSICKSWKNYSALMINRLIGSSGKFWHHESWDRIIRNETHYQFVVDYIEKNIRQGGVIWR